MSIRPDALIGWFIIFVVFDINSVSAFAHTKIPIESQSHLSHDSLSLLSALDTFVHNTLENNPAIQAAQASVLAAQSRQRAVAQPLYNPELAAEAQSAIDKTYSAGINQTIDWVDKQKIRTQVGSADAQVAEAQLRALRLQLAAEILNALVTYQSNAQVVLLAKERTQLLQKLASLTQKRYVNSDVARIDVDLAQLALSEAIVQQANAETNLNQALQILRSITGFTEAHWPQFPETLPNIKAKNIDVEKLAKKLPTLQVLSNQYLSAQARINLAEKQRYPDPTIGIQGGHQKGAERNKPLIGVKVSIPLFVRNTYSAEVAAARADVIEVAQKRLNLVRQIHAEIESSAERYEILYQAIQSWQKASGKSLSDGIVLLERLWQAGEVNTTDYLVQLKQRLDSQIAGAELKGRARQALVDWLKVSGQSDQKLDSAFIQE